MPLPRWLARLNRRTFNPRSIERETYPVLTHVGRKSGVLRRTPLSAYPVENGYVFIVNYGTERSDWVRNILHSGTATLHVDGRDLDLVAPRIISMEEAVAAGPGVVKPPPRFMNVTECLRMDLADPTR